jgi:hypothetical protein
MKRVLAVALLLLSCAYIALADGSDVPHAAKTANLTESGAVLLADGIGLPPTGGVAKPRMGEIAA